MKICITSKGDNLASDVDPRFGRAKYFIIKEADKDEFEAVENQNINGMGGVGVQTGGFMSDREVDVVITGNVGPNAFEVLNAAGIKVITGAKGTVLSALEDYNGGKISETSGPTAESHHGSK